MPYEIPSLSQQIRVLCFAIDPSDQIAMQDYGWILGWDVLICRDIESCLRAAEANRFDLIVADLNAGHKFCALELLKTIRIANSANAGLPALILSNRAIPGDSVQKAACLGDTVFRQKPLMLSDLKWAAARFTAQNCYSW